MEAVTTEAKAAALKGRMVSITTLVIYSANLKEIDELLEEKTQKAPAFFRGAPLLLDLTNLAEKVDSYWLHHVSTTMTNKGFIPVGMVAADDSLADIARTAAIPVWPSAKTSFPNTVHTENEEQDLSSADLLPNEPAVQNQSQEHTAATPHAPTMVLKNPVRSGQRVYAKGGDLIVLSSVNTGAEVMADGHIHVYGALRGRALAGVKGNAEARIFCHSLQADLIAIAGYYLTNEDLPADRRDKAVQISLSQEQLVIDAL